MMNSVLSDTCLSDLQTRTIPDHSSFDYKGDAVCTKDVGCQKIQSDMSATPFLSFEYPHAPSTAVTCAEAASPGFLDESLNLNPYQQFEKFSFDDLVVSNSLEQMRTIEQTQPQLQSQFLDQQISQPKDVSHHLSKYDYQPAQFADCIFSNQAQNTPLGYTANVHIPNNSIFQSQMDYTPLYSKVESQTTAKYPHSLASLHGNNLVHYPAVSKDMDRSPSIAGHMCSPYIMQDIHTAHSPPSYPTPHSPSHPIDTFHDLPRKKRAYKRKGENGAVAGGVNPKPKPKKSRAKRRKPKDPEDANAPPKPKRKTGLDKPLIPSPALSAVLGGDTELSRPEIVKKLWVYIKSNELQDPADRRFILCDNKLRSLFGQDRVNSFLMNRDLSAHLTNTTIDMHSPFDFKSQDEFCLGVLLDQKSDSIPVVCVSPTGTADTPDVMTPMEGYHV